MAADDTLRDQDGVVYEKRSHGFYEPKWEFLRQDYVRDRAPVERKPAAYTEDGKPLYRPIVDESVDTPKGTAIPTSSGGEYILYLVLFVIFIAAALFAVAILLTPIIAPILLLNMYKAKERQDLLLAKKYEVWVIVAMAFSILVVFVFAIQNAAQVFLFIASFADSMASQIAKAVLQLIAIGTAIVSVIFLFNMGISPSTLIYLHNKQKIYRNTGNAVAEQRLRLFKWLIGIIAIGTLAIFMAIFAGLILYQIASSLLTK
ncbi:MAG: hypothetical protein QME21_04665 [Anaerolineales bacterium]|nr:hypothetical protein [Anaerolineales bacterium]